MNKEIVSEIYRIKEVMNLNANLISEGVGTGILDLLGLEKKAKQWGKDFYDFTMGSGRRVNNRGILTINGVPVDQTFLDLIDRASNSTRGFWDEIRNSADSVKNLKLIGLIIRSDEALAKKIFDGIIENIKKYGGDDFRFKTSEEIKQNFLIALYKKMKDEDLSLDEALEAVFVDQNGVIEYQYVNGLRDEIQKGIDELSPVIKDRIDNPQNYVDVGVVTNFTDLFSVWQFSAQWLGNLVRKREDIIKDIEKTIQRINTKISQPAIGEPAGNIKSDLELLLNQIITLKKKGGDVNIEDFKKYLAEANFVNDEQFKDWYDANKAEIDVLMKNAKQSWGDQGQIALEAYLKTLLEYIPLVKFKSIGVAGGEEGLEFSKATLTNFLSRWGRRVALKNPNTIKELRRIRLLQGRNGYLLDKVVTAAVLVPTGYWIWDTITGTLKDNQDNIQAYNTLKKLYEEICGGKVTLDSEGKNVTVTDPTSDSSDCEKMKKGLQDMHPEELKKYIDYVIDSLKPGGGAIEKLIEGAGFAEVIDEVLFFTELDKLSIAVYDFITNQATRLDGIDPKVFVDEMIKEFEKNNEGLDEILKDVDLVNITDEKLNEVIDKIKNSKDYKQTTEPYKSVLEKYPKLYNWTTISTMTFEQNDTRFRLNRYSDNLEFKAQKNEDGTWSWVAPVQKPFESDGIDPTAGQQSGGGEQQQGGGGNQQQNVGGGTSLTPQKASELDFDLARFKREGTAQGIPVDATVDAQNNIVLNMNGTLYPIMKNSSGIWVYKDYPTTPVFDNSSNNQEQNLNNQGDSNTNNQMTNDSYINKKKIIKQINPKTLKESIKNKLLLKNEEKKYKIRKINENLRKFEEDFYYGNYNKFFKKMFKLGESFKNSKLYLNEDDNVTFDNALIQSGLFKGQEDRMKKEFCNYICNKLGLDNEIKMNFEKRINEYPFNDIGQLFTDTEKVVDLIYKSFTDSISDSTGTPNDFTTALQSTIKPYLKTADFERNFKSNLVSLSEPIMDNARKKVDDLVSKIKELLAKEDSES
jgi:hypothetical protein